MQGHQSDIHQHGGDNGLQDAHSDRLPAHALQRAEPELVADDKGDEAQCHLCDDAVALDLCKAPEAKAPAAQAQPTQKEGAQQKPRHQIRGDSRQTDRFRCTGCQQAGNERKGHANEQLLHKIRSSSGIKIR